MSESSDLDKFVFARRGELLAVPAVVLAAFGKPERVFDRRRIAAGVCGRSDSRVGGRLFRRDDAR